MNRNVHLVQLAVLMNDVREYTSWAGLLYWHKHSVIHVLNSAVLHAVCPDDYG